MASATFWPSLSDYKASVQNPQNCFSNEELRRGQVFTDRHGLPLGASGNSAVVYKFKSGSRTIAVRCFIQPVTLQQQHYTALNKHLAGLQIPGLAGFEYMLQGIRLRGQWYPIVKMEWVEGEPLHTFVERYRHNPYALLRLATELRELMNKLHANHVAHGDLQHDNVRVNPLLHMRLVDYDTMYVPSLRGIRSPEIGLANYQHPLRTNQDYNENLDNFSALVIYTSLLALATHPDLWQHHTGENLIFSANDYKAPQQSILLQKLKRSTNPEVQKLATVVEQCCLVTMSLVPKLEGIIAKQNIQQRVIISTLNLQAQLKEQQTSAAFRLPLRFESLRFYEDDSDIPPKEKRRYGTYFPQSVARYIYFELNLKNELWKLRDHTYRIEWRIYARHGGLIYQGHRDWVIKNEWDTPWYSNGFGETTPGRWTPGTYRVEILFDGVKYTEDVFIITHSQLGWNRYLEFQSLRFYERSWDIPSSNNYRYATYFPQSVARCIFFELNVSSSYNYGTKNCQVKWRYYNPSGDMEWENQDTWNIRSDLPRYWFSKGQGWKEYGRWTPGTYRVEILIDEVKFAEGTFNIVGS